MTWINKLESVHIFVKGIVIVLLHDFSGCCSTNLLHQLWSPSPLPATQGSTFGRQFLIACHVFVDCKSCTSWLHVMCFFIECDITSLFVLPAQVKPVLKNISLITLHNFSNSLSFQIFQHLPSINGNIWTPVPCSTFPIYFPNFPASAPHQWQHLHSASGMYRGRWVGKTHLSFHCFFHSKL